MSSYLYTWNPNKWTWVDYADAVYRVSNGKNYDAYWSCGRRKHINVGDVFFLMRLGEDPKGIVGCGYVSSSPYELPHWNSDRAEEGITALRTDLLFKALSDLPLISLIELKDRYPEFNWTPQGGGVEVPAEIADELFNELQSGSVSGFTPEAESEVLLYAEGKATTVTMNSYDRSSRARQDYIEHFGYSCFFSGFNTCKQQRL